MFRYSAALLGVLAIVTLAACKPEPAPGSIDVAGDSITVEALCGDSQCGSPAGDDRPDDVSWHAGLGWTMVNVEPRIEAAVTNGRPQTLVWALGTNDASPTHGGWGWPEIAQTVEFLDLPHPDACVVVVLPWLGSGARAAHRAEITKARNDLPTIAANRDGPTVVVDWADVVGPHARPELLHTDGIHLTQDSALRPDAQRERLELYWDGVRQCEDLL